MKRAFIIGNGTSREGFHLDNLRGETIYSCGIAHRGFTRPIQPTWHVTVEKYRQDMLIMEDGINPDVIRFPVDLEEHHELPEYHPGTHDPHQRPRNNAGMYAMTCAIRDGYTDLYILGFDSLILDNKDKAVSNMFTGRPETRTRFEDNANRARYLNWFMDHNVLCHFTYMFDTEHDFYPLRGGNVGIIDYEYLLDNM